MSREIKFRVWDKVTKAMHVCETNSHDTFFFDPYTCDFTYYNLQNGETSNGHSDYILEQYTGLKDKNGKKIYEGDIIQCHLSPISSTIFTGVVEFRPGCIMFKNFADSGAYAFNSLGAIEAVIGNIHENPELLGGEE